MTFADAKQRFSNRVADYTRYRPSYPPALLDLLAKECGLRADHVIADIGSGTGLLSKLFLEHGNHLYGVEPNGEMRTGGEDFFVAIRSSPVSTVPPKKLRSTLLRWTSSPPGRRFTGLT